MEAMVEDCSWFKNLCGPKRIELMCRLLRMCQPFELRFIGSILEDLAKKDYNYLREDEIKANDRLEQQQEFSKLTNVSDAVTRSKLNIYLALLHASNTVCSNILYNTLTRCYLEHIRRMATFSMVDTRLDACVLDEIHLLLTMAANHPAFTFFQRQKLSEYLNTVHKLVEAQQAHSRQSPFVAALPTLGEPLSHPHHHVVNNHDTDSNSSAITVEDIVVKGSQTKEKKAKFTLQIGPFEVCQLDLKDTISMDEFGAMPAKGLRQATWSDGDVSEVHRTYQQLRDFHGGLINLFPKDSGAHKQERLIPFFPQLQERGPTCVMVEPIEKYFKAIVKLPKYIVGCDHVKQLFQSSTWISKSSPVSTPSPSKDSVDGYGSPCVIALSPPVSTINYSLTIATTVGGLSPANSSHTSPHSSPQHSPSPSVLSSRSTSPGPSPGRFDISAWLKAVRLHKYEHTLRNKSLEELLAMKEKDFEDAIHMQGPRKKLMAEIQKLRVKYPSVNGVITSIESGPVGSDVYPDGPTSPEHVWHVPVSNRPFLPSTIQSPAESQQLQDHTATVLSLSSGTDSSSADSLCSSPPPSLVEENDRDVEEQMVKMMISDEGDNTLIGQQVTCQNEMNGSTRPEGQPGTHLEMAPVVCIDAAGMPMSPSHMIVAPGSPAITGQRLPGVEPATQVTPTHTPPMLQQPTPVNTPPAMHPTPINTPPASISPSNAFVPIHNPTAPEMKPMTEMLTFPYPGMYPSIAPHSIMEPSYLHQLYFRPQLRAIRPQKPPTTMMMPIKLNNNGHVYENGVSRPSPLPNVQETNGANLLAVSAATELSATYKGPPPPGLHPYMASSQATTQARPTNLCVTQQCTNITYSVSSVSSVPQLSAEGHKLVATPVLTPSAASLPPGAPIPGPPMMPTALPGTPGMAAPQPAPPPPPGHMPPVVAPVSGEPVVFAYHSVGNTPTCSTMTYVSTAMAPVSAGPPPTAPACPGPSGPPPAPSPHNPSAIPAAPRQTPTPTHVPTPATNSQAVAGCSACGCHANGHCNPAITNTTPSLPYSYAIWPPPMMFHQFPMGVLPPNSNGLVNPNIHFNPNHMHPPQPMPLPNGLTPPEVLYTGNNPHFSLVATSQAASGPGFPTAGSSLQSMPTQTPTHNTVSDGHTNYKPKKTMCCNCGGSGHLSSDCAEPTMENLTHSGGYHLNLQPKSVDSE